MNKLNSRKVIEWSCFALYALLSILWFKDGSVALGAVFAFSSLMWFSYAISYDNDNNNDKKE